MTNSYAPGLASRARPAVDPAPARNVLSLFLAGLADGWHAWRRYQRLRALGDGKLARLGIARGAVVRHAVLGARAAEDGRGGGRGIG